MYGGGGGYLAPRQKTQAIRFIGRGCHGAWQGKRQVLLIHVDADAWKADFQSRLKMPPEDAGAIRLYQVADPSDHADWSAQVTAERQVDVWQSGRHAAVRWEQVRRANHWLDAGYLGTAAAWYVREFLGQDKQAPKDGWFAAQKRGRA